MDNVTHTLVGLALSRAGLSRYSPRAAWTLALAANAPDLDVVSSLFGSSAYLDAHRHFTHSFAFLPVMALIPPAILRAATRKPVDWRPSFWLSAAGVLSHLLLDWLNLYGIRLLLPFSGAWLRLDWTPVVDPWMLVALALAFAAPALSRLVASEMGDKRRNPNAGRGSASAALAFLLLYNGGRGVMHARALETLESHVYRGEEPLRTAAFPNPLNPFRWRGLVEGGAFYALYDVDLNGRFDPLKGDFYPKDGSQEACRRASAAPPFRSFLRFAQYPVWTLAASGEGGGAVDAQVVDLRFGTPREPGFVATAKVTPDGSVLKARFRFGLPRPR